MADSFELYARNHRRQQAMLAGGLALFLLVGLVLRNERALFFVNGAQPTAFAAVVPPPAEFADTFVPTVMRRLRASPRLTPRGAPPEPGVTGLGGPEVPGAPAANEGLVPFTPEPVTGQQLASLPGFAGPSGGGLPQLGNASPVGTPVTTSTGGTPPTTSTGGTPPTTSTGGTDPVGPVPEPATWALFILGFFGIGAALRRRKSSAASSDAVRSS